MPNRPTLVADLTRGLPSFHAVRRRRHRSVTFAAPSGLDSLRDDLAGWLEEFAIDADFFVADVQLATVEVASDALKRSGGDGVTVAFDIIGNDVVVRLDYVPEGPPPSACRPQPPTGAPNPPGDSSTVDRVARFRDDATTADGIVTTLKIQVPANARRQIQLLGTLRPIVGVRGERIA